MSPQPLNASTEFLNFPHLPTELRLQIWEYACALPRIHFAKLLWMDDCDCDSKSKYGGPYHSGRWCSPVLTRATFPEKPLDWWNRDRPARSPCNPVALLHACREARQTYLQHYGQSLPIFNNMPDDTKEHDFHHLSQHSPIFLQKREPLQRQMLSWPLLYFNPSSDLLCLQIGVVNELLATSIRLGTYSVFRELTQLALEFRGLITRSWCPSCLRRKDRPGKAPVHHVDCLEQAYSAPRDLYRRLLSVRQALWHFPALTTAYLVDWGMKPLANVQPDRSCIRFTCNEYDFFEVQSREQWNMEPTPERPCQFESLDCAKAVEWAMAFVPKDRYPYEFRGDRVNDLERDPEARVRCRVLAAVPRRVEGQ